MFCGSCGRELPEEAVVCPFCGAKVLKKEESTSVAEGFTGSVYTYGHPKNDNPMAFNGASTYGNGAAYGAGAPAFEQAGKNTAAIVVAAIAAVAVLILVVCGLAAVWYRHSGYAEAPVAAEIFMDAMQVGDLDVAESYCDRTGFAYDKLEDISYDKMLSSLKTGDDKLDRMLESSTTLELMHTKMLISFVDKFDVKKAKRGSNGEYIVTVNADILDYDSMEKDLLHGYDDYLSNRYGDMISAYLVDGDESAYQTFANELLDLLDSNLDVALSYPYYKDTEFTVSLKKTGDQWVVEDTTLLN